MVQLKEEDDLPLENGGAGLVMVCVGEAGGGKSSLLNFLLSKPGHTRDNQIFLEGEGAEPCTKHTNNKAGFWRGNPDRPVTAVDTAGVGEGPEEDTRHVLDAIDHLKSLGYVHVFVIVVKGGQLRFLSQHQIMFRMFETMFGESFWENVVIDVSNQMNDKSRNNFESWMQKLCDNFPAANLARLRKVYVDVEMADESTIEHFWNICKQMKKYPCQDFHTAKTQIKKLEDKCNKVVRDVDKMKLSLDTFKEEQVTKMYDREVSTTLPRGEIPVAFPYSPLLPPRSPTFSKPLRVSRTPSFTSGSLTNLQLPKSYMPPTNLVDPFIPTSSVTLRSLRRSRTRDMFSLCSRETSPVSSISSSRETSPSRSVKIRHNSSSSSIPTFLRTSYAMKYPFIKAVKDNSEPLLNHATEERVLLESIDFFYLTSAPHFHTVSVKKEPSNIGHMISIAYQTMDFLLDEHMENMVMEIESKEIPNFETVTELEEEERNLDLLEPDTPTDDNPLLMVRKALLPKIKYRWEQGFRQGTTGWEKVPILKIKFKYGEEESLLLPAILSVEGGRWCESKKVPLDIGRGKVKLKADEDTAPQLRVVPLNKEERQEMWVPEFLFSVETAYKAERLAGDKWCKVKLSPAMPE